MDRENIGSAPPARLRVEVRTVDASELLAPVGELDHYTAELLRSPLDEALDAGRSRLVVDCSGLEFCDSTGLNVLLGARLRADAARRWRPSRGDAARGGPGVPHHGRGGRLHRARDTRHSPSRLIPPRPGPPS